MKINSAILNKISYIYLCLPMIIFFLANLKPLFGIISSITLIITMFFIFKCEKNHKHTISKKCMLITIAISMLWVWQSGIGGYFYQNTDWHLRNAILKDLIDFAWPVKYDNGSNLIYYMGQMLPAALCGKIAGFLGANSDQAFKIGNFFNYLWTTIGITIISLQLITIINSKNKQFIIIMLILIFFSGLDVLYISHPQIEWHWTLQYSCNTTLLFWVYNQTIAPWLITLLLFKKPYAIKNFAPLATICLFFAPLPFSGIFIYVFGITITKLFNYIKHKKLKLFLKNIFSIQNILTVLILFPIMYFYYKSNTMVENSELRTFSFSIKIAKFFILEAGIFLAIICHKYYKNLLFKLTFLSLLLFPFIRFGNTLDLCMRGSIPALFMLMIFVTKFLFDKSANKILKIILSICLLVGAVTPLLEIQRGWVHTIKPSSEPYIKMDIGTLNNKIQLPCATVPSSDRNILVNHINYCNYGTLDTKNTIFFKYLSR